MPHDLIMIDRAASPSTNGDANSDYGPEFTPEEDGLVNEMLLNLPVEQLVADDNEVSNSSQQCGIRGRNLQVVSRNSKVEGDLKGKWTQVHDETYVVSSVQSNTRSPLERFRTARMKPLSVTDLVSPAWCELQYFYSLVKYGRIKRTSAMKRGSAVHQALEEEVYKTVAIDVTTAEDALGLRLWNMIQGLRTLRHNGITREFEIWGVVDGLLVIGIIDEISFTCPDEGLEVEGLSGPEMEANASPSADQALTGNWVPPKKVYLADVKTRRAKNLPNGAPFRPALFQLMLYHRFFSNLASGSFDAGTLFRHYQVDISTNFSDSFISQITALDKYNNNRVARTGIGRTGPGASQDFLGLLENNSVQSLWGLMMQEFHLTVPAGMLGIGNVLRVEYRSQTDGSVIGQKTFLHRDRLLDRYLADRMMWWRGGREGRGVIIEEAYKCQSCEFVDTCTWRAAKIEELANLMSGKHI